MTADDYRDLHSGERYEAFKHTIASITLNEEVARDTLSRVLRGRFHSDAFVAAINRENPNFQWKTKHKTAIANLSDENEATQQRIKNCGIKEKPQGKGGNNKRKANPKHHHAN